MTEHSCVAIVLAAGKGVRMRSSLPKVLHPLAGRPLVWHVVEAARAAGVDDLIAVVGHEAGRVRAVLGPNVTCVEQEEQLGTGHAVERARDAAAGFETILVLSGDVPLTTAATLRELIERHRRSGADITFVTAEPQDRTGLGRVVRDEGGSVRAIVEAADAGESTLAIAEINVGAYCLRASWLWARLGELPTSANGERYLTALVERAVTEGGRVDTLRLAEPAEGLGVNDREQLARAEALMRRRVLRRLMLDDGVTIIDPATTYIDAGVTIGRDTVIEPNTHVRGESRVGANCVIGPNAVLRDARVGENCRVAASTLEDCDIENEVGIGPYCHLRLGAYLESGVHVGNYVEIKASRIGRGARLGHFCYVGDAVVGAEVNIGAGAVTCNFDGERKHQTVIGDGAFIGSDTMLVAPVRVGVGAKTGAGAVVTGDVADGEVVVGVPARSLAAARREGGPYGS